VANPEPHPRLIKKYTNRKLYDTTSRRYITLERIGELVRGGENIQVVDRGSGEDLTAVTLSQVVLDNERKRHGAVPEQLLQQLVRNPGEAVIGAVRQSISAVQDQIQRAEERVVRPDVALEEALEKTLARTLRGLKIPSQRDMQRFERRLTELASRVDRLAATAGPISGGSARKQGTAPTKRGTAAKQGAAPGRRPPRAKAS
jgi:polyhydroxyalkanoate synthesis repressor PhaR